MLPVRDGRIEVVTVALLRWIRVRALALGERPLCNLQKARAPHVAGVCLPLCARCLGLLAGWVFYLIPWFSEMLEPAPIALRGLMIVLLPLDHLLGRFEMDPGTNLRRFLTGVLFSFGWG